jgi:hypothetical protein
MQQPAARWSPWILLRGRRNLGRAHRVERNHTHYAERLFTGTQVIGGGDRALGWRLPADGGDGLVLPGAVLGSAGVMAANMHPDHAILYRAEALD